MWKTTELFDDYSHWELEINKTNDELISLLKEKNNQSIEEALLSREKFAIKLDRLYTYGLLIRELYIDDTYVYEKINSIKKLYNTFNIYNEYLQQQLIINKKEIYDSFKCNSVLKKYKNDIVKSFDDINKDKNQKNSIDLYRKISPYDYFLKWYFSFENIGKQSNGQNITEHNLLKLLKNPNRDKRKYTYVSVEKFLKNISNTAAYILNSHLQLSNNISHDYLFEVRNAFCDLSWEDIKKLRPYFMDLNKLIIKYKSQSLNLSSISYFDLYYLPNEYNKRISKDEAQNIITESSKLLGKEISSVVKQVFDDNWINWENSGHYGQRSFSSYTTHPYIKISWDGTLDSLFNLAHEILGAVAQYYSGLTESFFYSELSILKTEFISYLGTWSLYEYLRKHPEIIDPNLLKDKFIDFIKDVFISPYSYTYIEYTLFLESQFEKLSNERISDIWYEFIYDYHDCDQFEHLEINRYNWVRNEHFYLKGYDLNYIIAFALSLNYYYNDFSNKKLVSLLSCGEINSDNNFFRKLGFNKDIYDLLLCSIEFCSKFLHREVL